MLIINADDWGRSLPETDAALACHRRGRVTSVSAMVFMKDSARAAKLATENQMDVGLHLNLSQPYDGPLPAGSLAEAQAQIVDFMEKSKYAVLFYHPFLRRQFRDVYQNQTEEFMRLYGKMPSHIDGHQHRHLCANMLIDEVVPRGQTLRRNFSFWPGEKSFVNRSYRSLIDKWLGRRYRLVDFFFSLQQCLGSNRLSRVAELAKVSHVELMAHPGRDSEYAYLMSDGYLTSVRNLQMGTYSQI